MNYNFKNHVDKSSKIKSSQCNVGLLDNVSFSHIFVWFDPCYAE